MEGKLYSVQGKELGAVQLDDAVFGLPRNEDVIYYAVHNELANIRVGSACTKGRAEVHGTNRRPYAQKGTGRARQGDVKSPVYVGGGIVFGPKPRDYSYRMPRKAKRLAIKTILSLKAQEKVLKVVQDFTIPNGKTKDLAAIMKVVLPRDKNERTVVILKDDDADIKRAGKNIPWLHFLSFNRLRAHDLFYGRSVVVLESAVKSLNEFYANT